MDEEMGLGGVVAGGQQGPGVGMGMGMGGGYAGGRGDDGREEEDDDGGEGGHDAQGGRPLLPHQRTGGSGFEPHDDDALGGGGVGGASTDAHGDLPPEGQFPETHRRMVAPPGGQQPHVRRKSVIPMDPSILKELQGHKSCVSPFLSLSVARSRGGVTDAPAQARRRAAHLAWRGPPRAGKSRRPPPARAGLSHLARVHPSLPPSLSLFLIDRDHAGVFSPLPPPSLSRSLFLSVPHDTRLVALSFLVHTSPLFHFSLSLSLFPLYRTLDRLDTQGSLCTGTLVDLSGQLSWRSKGKRERERERLPSSGGRQSSDPPLLAVRHARLVSRHSALSSLKTPSPCAQYATLSLLAPRPSQHCPWHAALPPNHERSTSWGPPGEGVFRRRGARGRCGRRGGAWTRSGGCRRAAGVPWTGSRPTQGARDGSFAR